MLCDSLSNSIRDHFNCYFDTSLKGELWGRSFTLEKKQIEFVVSESGCIEAREVTAEEILEGKQLR